MTFEIELKARCPGCAKKAEELGAKFIKSERQEDTYYAHPCRDFKNTDEALRIRKTDFSSITYKGPKRKGDLKMREEIEFDVGEEAGILLERIGFKKSFTVTKKRQVYELDGVIICCDVVEGLGEYVELEAKSQDDAAKISEMARKFGVESEATTKSYSELLGL